MFKYLYVLVFCIAIFLIHRKYVLHRQGIRGIFVYGMYSEFAIVAMSYGAQKLELDLSLEMVIIQMVVVTIASIDMKWKEHEEDKKDDSLKDTLGTVTDKHHQ